VKQRSQHFGLDMTFASITDPGLGVIDDDSTQFEFSWCSNLPQEMVALELFRN